MVLLVLGGAAPSAMAADPTAATATPAGTGLICLVPFHTAEPLGPGLPPPAGEANLSETTWGPSPDSKFEFRLDKKLVATVPRDRMVAIHDVPVDRRVLLSIRLDGRPFESFPVELGKEPDHRLCLWLRPGYWHWSYRYWEPRLGCRCEAAPAAQP